jgi:hypothetical protein
MMLKPIVRQYVSGDRRRYKAEDGTNLDLSYIQDNIIGVLLWQVTTNFPAMSFPASGFIETVRIVATCFDRSRFGVIRFTRSVPFW